MPLPFKYFQGKGGKGRERKGSEGEGREGKGRGREGIALPFPSMKSLNFLNCPEKSHHYVYLSAKNEFLRTMCVICPGFTVFSAENGVLYFENVYFNYLNCE